MQNTAPTPANAVPSDGRTMRVYCTTHSLGFTTGRAQRLLCENGGHELDSDFPKAGFWEYCCDCQSFIPSNFVKGGKAAPECAVCDRQTSRRFVCAECCVVSYESDSPARGKFASLTANGSPQPVCPGCLRPTVSRLRSHSCEVVGAFFTTPRSTCPFCKEEIALPLSFPMPVAELMRDFKGEKISVQHNAAEWLLVESDAGEFIVIPHGADAMQAILLPKTAHFNTAEDFSKHYKDYYDCDSPDAGDVVILSPAVVKEAAGGWKIAEAGRLEINRAGNNGLPTARVSGSASPQEAQRRVCTVCQTVAKPSHKFCKACGAGLQDLGNIAPDQPSMTVQPAFTSTAPVFAAESPSLDMSTPFGQNSAAAPTLAAAPSAFGSGKILGIMSIAFVVIVVAVLTLRSGSLSITTEGKLENAITRGNLIAPSGDSAYDYYYKLKQEGVSASKLETYDRKLLPLLTALPERLMSDLVNKPENAERPLAEWQDAQKLMAWASEIRPADKSLAAKAEYCRGRVAYLQERWDDALQAWTQSSSFDSSWALPINGVGLIYNNKKDYSTARTYLQQAIRLSPKWAAPYNNMGTSYFMEKNFYEAKGYYEQAKELAPQWARPYAWLGDIAFEWGDHCRAREMYQASIERAPAGMSNWNPQRMQRKVEAAAAKCNTLSQDTRRIEFGRGDTVTTVTGMTTAGDNYVIKAMAYQTMTVNLNSDDNNATLQVFDSAMSPLSGRSSDTFWSGTIRDTADYNILVKPVYGTARYTFTVSIPPLS